MEAIVGSTDPAPVDWRGLAAAEPEALATASTEAEMFVRALAAYGVIIDDDAVLSELEDRQTTLRAKLWPAEPLEDYGLHASLGAFLVTKVAIDLVPTGHVGLRSERLSPDALRQALISHGLTEQHAGSLVSDWPGVSDDFRGEPEGLSISVLAGLAARTLTRDERSAALAQVAVSPRDLARLVASTNLLSAVRIVLPLLPIPSLGTAYDVAVVGLSVGRPDRVAALLNPPDDVFFAALCELAAAMAALRAGEPYAAEADVQVATPEVSASDATSDDDDDVIEIVEDGVGLQVCMWREGAVATEDLAAWQEVLRKWQATRGTLGLRLPAPPATVAGEAVPPEAGLVRRSVRPSQGSEAADPTDLVVPRFRWRGDPLDAIAPVVRAAVRMVAAATEGRSPVPGALERAGDLAWLVRRASALAAVVKGDLPRAIAATEIMSLGAAPERRWAQDRLRRFGERTAEPAEPEEARPMGAALMSDLAHQLARTVTDTVPRERR